MFAETIPLPYTVDGNAFSKRNISPAYRMLREVVLRVPCSVLMMEKA